MTQSSFNVARYLDRIRLAFRGLRYKEHILGTVGDFPVSVWTRAAFDIQSMEPLASAPTCFLSAGIHGDEPAGPLAVTRLLQYNQLAPDINWHIAPLINPTGIQLGTRENQDGVDLNRDFVRCSTREIQLLTAFIAAYAPTEGYDLTVCLHEDNESEGCYLYQVDETPGAAALANVFMIQLQQHIPLDPSPMIDGHLASGGCIRPSRETVEEHMRSQAVPEALWLIQHHTRRSYTIETPSQAYIADRVAAQAAAIMPVGTSLLRRNSGVD